METRDGTGTSQVCVKSEPEWHSTADHIKVVIKLEEECLWERAPGNDDAAGSPEITDAALAATEQTCQDFNPASVKQGKSTDIISLSHPESYVKATSDQQTTDSEEYPYNCDTCGKTFEQKHNLIQHIKKSATDCIPLENFTYSEKKQPTGNKAFWCEICEKQFRDSSDIARHRRIHTGEKPYACDVCKKQFAQLSVLIRHKRIHTDEKPFQCDICDKQFRASSDLSKHRRIHGGLKRLSCEICKKEFKDANDLANHKSMHKGRMSFSCQVCKKKFALPNYLKKHEKRVHSYGCF